MYLICFVCKQIKPKCIELVSESKDPHICGWRLKVINCGEKASTIVYSYWSAMRSCIMIEKAITDPHFAAEVGKAQLWAL